MVVLQTIVIIVGMFLLRAFSDLLVEDSLQEPRFSALVRGVRSGGLALLLIPAVWAAGTIYLERLESGWYRRRWSFASGIVLWLGLAWLFLYCVGQILIPVY